MSLPRVIFFENHRDSITFQVISKLAPEFKKLGYQVFLDEMPGSTTIESVFSDMEKGDILYNQLRDQLLDEYPHIDINNPEDLKNEYFTDPSGSGPAILEFIEKHQALKAMAPFLTYMQDQGIQYKGVDIEEIKATKNIDLLLLNEERNKSIMDGYLKEQKGAYGRAGIMHAQGLHNLILLAYPENPNSQFICFYIYSKEPIFKEEKGLRSEKYPYLIKVDASKTKIDDIRKIVIETILEKKKFLETLEKKGSSSPGQLFKQYHQKVISLSAETGIPSDILDQYFQKDQGVINRLNYIKDYLYNHNHRQSPALSLEQALTLKEEEVLNLHHGYDLIASGKYSMDQVKCFNRDQRTIVMSGDDLDDITAELTTYSVKNSKPSSK